MYPSLQLYPSDSTLPMQPAVVYEHATSPLELIAAYVGAGVVFDVHDEIVAAYEANGTIE